MRKVVYLPSLIIGLVAGSAITAAVLHKGEMEEVPDRGELHLGQKEFINPLVDCPSRPRGASPNKAELQDHLLKMIGKYESTKSSGVDEVSVLFRDLNNGPGLGINNKEPFVAASLLKLPILMAFLKRQATWPKLLDSTLKFDPEKDGNLQRRPTVSSIHPPMQGGESYSVRDLLNRMIVDSDNIATAMLMKHFPDVSIDQGLRDMGVPVTLKGDEAWINVEDYGSIYRILYNSTYLGPELSNEALGMLAKSTFNQGLVAGVAKDIPVAHKFGEREFAADIQQFHDCGIIYYPLRPYLLCVMTKGTKQKELINAIAQISQAVFEQVKKDSEVH